MAYIIARLREPSTWVGLFGIISGVTGLTFGQELVNSVVAAGVAGAGLAAVLLNTTGKA